MEFKLQFRPNTIAKKIVFATWTYFISYTIASTGIDLCPAVKAPNSNTYISYDRQFQAATLEEAVANFVDPVTDNSFQARTLYGTLADGKTPQRCNTIECLNCYELLYDRLQPFVANLPPVSSLPNGQTLDSKRQKTCKNLQTPQQSVSTAGSLSSADQTLSAGKSANQQQLTNVTSSPAANFNDALKIASLLVQSHLTSTKVEESSSNTTSNTSTPFPSQAARNKRDTTPGGSVRGALNATFKLGVRTTLNCSYIKGSPIEDQSPTSSVLLTGLCNLCWSLRTLPSRYFPRFLSELSCDDGRKNGTACLSGYGSCRERFRQVDVLYNQGSDAAPVWAQQSLGIVASCECRVSTSSAMFNLVKN